MKNTKIQLRQILKSLFILLGIFCSTLSHAATVTWMGGNGSWSDASQWDAGYVPDGGDDVIIPSGTVTLSNYEGFARSVEVQTAGRLYIYNGSLLNIAGAVDNPGLHNMGRVYVWGKMQINDIQTTSNNNLGHGIQNDYVMYFFSSAYVAVFECEDQGIQNDPSASFWNFGSMEIFEVGRHNIDNEGLFRNSGKLNLSANTTFPNYGVANSDRFWNYSSGSIIVNGGGGGAFANSNSNSHLKNYGSFIVKNSAGSGFSTGGVIDNFSGGFMQASNCGSSGIYINTSGQLINHGDIQSLNAGFAGIYVGGELINHSYLVCNNSQSYGMKTQSGSSVVNHDFISLNTAGSDDMFVEGDLMNEQTGKFFTNKRLYLASLANFINEGVLVSFSNFPNIISAGSILSNYGIIEDHNGMMPAVVDNQQVIVEPLGGALQAGIPYGNALNIGSLSNVTVNAWLTGINGISAGTYDPATNEFTPNANAMGLNELVVRIEMNSTGFERNYRVKVPGGISMSSAVHSGEYSDLHEAGKNTTFLDPPALANKAIDVYPNPSQGQVYTEHKFLANGPTTILVYNAQGEAVGKVNLNSSTERHNIDLPEALPNGFYVLRFCSKTDR
jgi:hypothetical protein